MAKKQQHQRPWLPPDHPACIKPPEQRDIAPAGDKTDAEWCPTCGRGVTGQAVCQWCGRKRC